MRMTIQVNIGEAKTRLSELVAAAVHGEDVVLAKAGVPHARIVPIADHAARERERIAACRKASFGMFAKEFEGWNTDIPPLMTDDEIAERWQRFEPSV